MRGQTVSAICNGSWQEELHTWGMRCWWDCGVLVQTMSEHCSDINVTSAQYRSITSSNLFCLSCHLTVLSNRHLHSHRQWLSINQLINHTSRLQHTGDPVHQTNHHQTRLTQYTTTLQPGQHHDWHWHYTRCTTADDTNSPATSPTNSSVDVTCYSWSAGSTSLQISHW